MGNKLYLNKNLSCKIPPQKTSLILNVFSNGSAVFLWDQPRFDLDGAYKKNSKDILTCSIWSEYKINTFSKVSEFVSFFEL